MARDKTHIYMPLEILFREFSPKLLLSYFACMNGFRVYIGTKAGIDKILKSKSSGRSGIYFSNQILNKPKFVSDIKSKCEHFVVSDEELGAAVANLKFSIKNRVKNSKLISKYLVLSEKIKKEVIKQDRKFKPITEVTGWTKYDFYRDKNKNFYFKEAKEIKKEHGNFFLLSSNYGALSSEGLNRILKKNKHLKKLKNSKLKNNDYLTFVRSIKDFEYLKTKISNFLSKNKKTKLIIRPHPSDELHSDWNKVAKLENLQVIYKRDIIPWIIASKGLIHRGCSTAIDAYFLQKKIFYFKPNRKILSSEKNLTYKISEKIDSFEEILSFKKNKNNNNLIKKEICFDTTPSYLKIIRSFKNLVTQKEYPIRINVFDNFIFYIVPVLGYAKRVIYNFLQFSSIETKNNKIPEIIKKKTIEDKIKKIDTNNLITVKEVSREVFEIDKK